MSEETKSKGTSAFKVFIGVLLALFVFVGGCTALFMAGADDVLDEMEEQDQAIENAATITECSNDEFLGASAAVEFVNPLDEKLDDAWVDVSFFDADGTLVASGTAFFQNVEPGAKAVSQAESFEEIADVTCEISGGSGL